MSNTAPPQLAKKLLRRKVGEVVAQQMEGESGAKIRERETALVVQKLLTNEWFCKAKRLSIYVSNDQEICTDSVMRKALREGKEVFIPRFKKGAQQMEMLRLESEKEFDSLECTLWGIRQHSAILSPPSFEETTAAAPLDLVVMPGVAFTTCGKRLGHGRGFYDRFLNEYAQKYGTVPKTIGLALKVQLVDDLPVESKDRMVDEVIHA